MQEFVMAHPWMTFFMFGTAVNGVVMLLRGYSGGRR